MRCAYRLARPCSCLLVFPANWRADTTEQRREALQHLQCTTSHPCVRATLDAPAVESVPIHVAWDATACPQSAQRRHLVSMDNIRLKASRDGVILRCGYDVAPPPWPGLAVAPLRFETALAAADAALLAQAQILLQQLRLTEARALITQVVEHTVGDVEALVLLADVDVLLGDLATASGHLTQLAAHVSPAQREQIEVRQDRVNAAADAWKRWESDASCEAIYLFTAIARGHAGGRLASARCLLQAGE